MRIFLGYMIDLKWVAHQINLSASCSASSAASRFAGSTSSIPRISGAMGWSPTSSWAQPGAKFAMKGVWSSFGIKNQGGYFSRRSWYRIRPMSQTSYGVLLHRMISSSVRCSSRVILAYSGEWLKERGRIDFRLSMSSRKQLSSKSVIVMRISFGSQSNLRKKFAASIERWTIFERWMVSRVLRSCRTIWFCWSFERLQALLRPWIARPRNWLRSSYSNSSSKRNSSGKELTWNGMMS